jgi:molybdenum cofactor cytidylyltransferase
VNVDGIILAAGTSTRFGRTKQLLNWVGTDGVTRPLIRHVIEIALQSNLRRIYVVIGNDKENVETAVGQIVDNDRLHLIENKDFAAGQSTSVIAGLAALETDARAAMFLLCDQPKISPRLINDLIDLHEREIPLICAPVANQRRGNPVIFTRDLFPELSLINGDTGGRALISKYWDQASKLRLESDDVFMDIDTIDDLP